MRTAREHRQRASERGQSCGAGRLALGITLVFAALSCGRGGKRPPAQATLLSAPQSPVPGAHAHGDRLPPLDEAAGEARPIEGLGSYGRRLTTTDGEAQAFFDQGMRLYWAFNHDEAYRSFARAAKRDPRCALCFWGAALSLGPNYNMPMMPDRAQIAWDALTKAREVAPGASPVERRLVEALGARYTSPAAADEQQMAKQSRAYAERMREVAEQHRDDIDVQSLFAESMMVLNPWKLWTLDGSPAPLTMEIVATLEAALGKSPAHPGANHLYIHAIEASKQPQKGVPSADRVGSMMPNAGHLVHMPSHIYQRVGRYEDSAEANRRAIEGDRRYVQLIAPRPPPRVYEMYMGHNAQFLAFADAMQGKGGEAIEAARMGGRISREATQAMPMIEFFAALPHMMMLRFGKWADVLAAPAPDPSFPTAKGLWHHARGMASAALSRPEDAQAELEKLLGVVHALPPNHMAMNNASEKLLRIAVMVLEGKIAGKRDDTTTAVRRLEDAARLEDTLAYDEPPNWWYPVRHVLGATHLAAHRASDAETVYRADLSIHPENGWSLSGLAKALEMQGKTVEAKTVNARARTAWRNADIPLAGSWLDAP